MIEPKKMFSSGSKKKGKAQLMDAFKKGLKSKYGL
jgi:hypothetical protein